MSNLVRERRPDPADVIVIGAGHNGLTAGCYLARSGLDVLVVEASSVVGGMATTLPVIPGAPEHQINLCAMDLFFIRASTVPAELGLHRYGYRDIDLDPQSVHFAEDGTTLAYWRDPSRTSDEIRRFSAKDARAFLKLAERLDAFTDIAVPALRANLLRPDMGTVKDLFGVAGRSSRDLLYLARMLAGTMANVVEETFEHPAVRTMLLHGSFGGPILDKGSGMLMVYWGWYHRFGAGRAAGGTGALPKALLRCFEDHGGQTRLRSPVAEVLLSGGRAAGVRLASGEELHARAVVASCDPKQTLTELLPEGALSARLTKRAERIPTAGNASMKIDIALRGQVRVTTHQKSRHDGLDLRIPYTFRGDFDQQVMAAQQVNRGQVPDFVPYIATLPTAIDPTQAPEGQDTVYIWASRLPLEPRESWQDVSERVTKQILADVATYYDGVEELEIGRAVETVPDMRDRTRATHGNWGHVDFTIGRMGPVRPALGFGGYRTSVDGLFLSGAGTHPGPGLSCIPGQLAAREVQRALKK